MNKTRLAILAILVPAILGGALMYYMLAYAGYAELTQDEVGEIQLINVLTGEPDVIMFENVKGIDTVVDGVRLSGAISFRACFDVPQDLTALSETYTIMDNAVPLTTPSWFDCFDAREIGEALEAGTATAFISARNITFGVDRVVAILPDGRGFAWHQLNICGTSVFAGDTAPEGCPDTPEDF